MTTEVKKTIRATGGVLACLAAIGTGAILRDRVELGPGADSQKLDTTNLVASTAKTPVLPETKFFSDIKELLERKYVNPIPDESKLADGAVRGMIASLGDPNSLYMDSDQLRVYTNVRNGKYEGIGADLVLARDRSQAKATVPAEPEGDQADSGLPKLVIAAVVPGGAADKAGLQPGDWAEFVDDHWVPNNDALTELTDLYEQAKLHKEKIPEFVKMRRELRDDSDKRILPIKARDRLMMGTSGEIRTQWVRGTKRIQASLSKSAIEMPGFRIQADGSIRLPFVAGASNQLKLALGGKANATIDLRNNVEGDFEAMLECLKVVAPNGNYGYLVTRKSEKPDELSISDGSTKRIKLTLLVDKTTRGAAEIFATALSSRGIAKQVGGPMAGNLFVANWYTLPDGAGYTLVTSEYRSSRPSATLAEKVVTPTLPNQGNGMLPPKINPGMVPSKEKPVKNR